MGKYKGWSAVSTLPYLIRVEYRADDVVQYGTTHDSVPKHQGTS